MATNAFDNPFEGLPDDLKKEQMDNDEFAALFQMTDTFDDGTFVYEYQTASQAEIFFVENGPNSPALQEIIAEGSTPLTTEDKMEEVQNQVIEQADKEDDLENGGDTAEEEEKAFSIRVRAFVLRNLKTILHKESDKQITANPEVVKYLHDDVIMVLYYLIAGGEQPEVKQAEQFHASNEEEQGESVTPVLDGKDV